MRTLGSVTHINVRHAYDEESPLFKKKNKVNLTVIKVTAINEKEKAKLQAQRKEGLVCFAGNREKKKCKISCEIKGCLLGLNSFIYVAIII